MPGTKQAEDLTTETAGEKTIHLVHTPHQPTGQLIENFAPQGASEVHARSSPPEVPNIIEVDVQAEFVRDRFSERQKELLYRFQVGGVQLLKICKDHLASGCPRLV